MGLRQRLGLQAKESRSPSPTSLSFTCSVGPCIRDSDSSFLPVFWTLSLCPLARVL